MHKANSQQRGAGSQPAAVSQTALPERQLRRDAEVIYRAALQAADAGVAVRRNLQLNNSRLRVGTANYQLRDFDRIYLLAVGKAAGAMALAVEHALGVRLTGGLVITKHGHRVEGLRVCRQTTSAHPVPDADGEQAGNEAEAMLRECNARDLLLVAVSGGASALLPAPVAGITMEAKRKMTDLLLRAGADITRLNIVRKHLSRLKGGGLAALAYPAAVAGLLLSDVIGDDPGVIGSGLTAADGSTYAEALEILDLYRLRKHAPRAIVKHLEAGSRGERPETPKLTDPIWKNVSNVIVGSNETSLSAAKRAAQSLGYRTAILSSSISGETREAAGVLCEILRETALRGSPLRPPACLLAGGETTVTVRGKGRGGRNQEFALSAARSLSGLQNVLALSLGTDGTDGPTNAAGALATGATWERAAKFGLNGVAALDANDSYPFFQKLNDLVITGPTGTNVMDICILLAR